MPSTSLTRRALIAGTGAAVASVALAVPYVNAAPDDTCSLAVDPVARYDAAVAELKAAALALRPDLDVWKINQTEMGVLVFGYSSVEAAKPITIKWDGDGVYELYRTDGKREVWNITRAPEYDHGAERWFRMSTGFNGPLEPEDWCCPERNLPALSRKIRSLA